MKKSKNLWLIMAAGLAAGGMYHLARGDGIFNKPRFAKQHQAVKRYLAGNHPGAVYSSIKEAGNGWSCVVRQGDMQFILYLTCSDDGVYVFHEHTV